MAHLCIFLQCIKVNQGSERKITMLMARVRTISALGIGIEPIFAISTSNRY